MNPIAERISSRLRSLSPVESRKEVNSLVFGQASMAFEEVFAETMSSFHPERGSVIPPARKRSPNPLSETIKPEYAPVERVLEESYVSIWPIVQYLNSVGKEFDLELPINSNNYGILMERLDEVLLDKTGWDCPFIQESDLFNQQPMLDFPMIYCDHENNGWITAILEGREAVESLINHYLDGDFNESDKWPENSMSPEEIATFKEIGVSMLLDIYIKSDSQKSFDLQAALDWQALFAPLFDGNEPEDISGCGFPVLGDSSACTYINRVEDITFYINYCQAFNQFYSNIPVFSWGNDSDNTKDGAWDWFRELLKIAKDSKQQSLIEYLEAA